VIDGYSQSGAHADDGQRTNWQKTGIDAVPRIELDGSGMQAGEALIGLIIATGDPNVPDSGSTVQGLVINRFVDNASREDLGIDLRTGGGNQIQGNFIGTDVSGTLAPSGAVDMSSSLAPTTGMHVGVSIWQGSGNNRIGTDGNGVNDAAERNLLSALSAGVGIQSPAMDNVVAGNFIGTDRKGTNPLGNWFGIALQEGTTGNRIGTDGTGPDVAAERNIISGNKVGLGPGSGAPSFSNTLVAGNFIGTDVSGANNLGNLLAGVVVASGSSNDIIGGSDAALANIIAFNQGPGVWIVNSSQLGGSSSGIKIRGNSIHDNGGLAIDLGGDYLVAPPIGAIFDGVTPNDPGDGDIGPNNLQNYPVLTGGIGGATTRLAGTLNSTPNSTFVLDFYANTSQDSSGYGEGELYLGSAVAMTDANGDVRDPLGNLGFTVVLSVADASRPYIAATATDLAGNTSEFSAVLQLTLSDTDGDGIENSVDVLPGTFSNGFSDGATTGDITSRGGQTISIVNAPNPAEGLLITADFSVAAAPAAIEGNGGTVYLTGGDQILYTHGSLILQVLAGTIEATFMADSGQVATTSLTAGNGLTFEPDSFTFVAPTTNTQTVHVISGGNELTVGPGAAVRSVQIDVKPGDANTVNLESNGVVSVAIVSTAGFNASEVLVSSVVFAGAHAITSSLKDVNGDGRVDLVLQFRTQDTTFRSLYSQLLADDIDADGILDSNHQTANVSLTGETVDQVLISGFDTVDLFLSGKKLRSLLDQLAAAGEL
jgi:hypothetical protein